MATTTYNLTAIPFLGTYKCCDTK